MKSPNEPTQTPPAADAPEATVPPPGHVCPECRDNDRPAFDGDRWYCWGCDGHTDGDGTWVDATYIPAE